MGQLLEEVSRRLAAVRRGRTRAEHRLLTQLHGSWPQVLRRVKSEISLAAAHLDIHFQKIDSIWDHAMILTRISL